MENITENIIIALVNAVCNGEDSKTKKTKKWKYSIGNQYGLYNCGYLLNQVLRQINIPKKRYHNSKGAIFEWKKITNENVKNIENCIFDEPIKSKGCNCQIYKSNNAVAVEKYYEEGKNIRYNDIFHSEHIVPISVIKKNLLELCRKKELNVEGVRKELKKIHICRITKKENIKLNKIMKDMGISDNKRSDNWKENIKKLYIKAGIEMYDK